MAEGNCYQANFDEMIKNPDTYNSDEWRLVHAMRENVKGSEWWGGHCFLLNTEENLVFDFSNGAMMKNNGKELVIDADEIYEQWSICKDGNQTYFEYTFKSAIEWAYESGHYGSWELKFELWKEDDWITYMQEYWVPTHEPRRHALEQANKK